MRTKLLSFLLLLPSILAHSLQLPIRTQLPLIARINTPYTWSISNATFADTRPDELHAVRIPAWLTLNGLELSGTPAASDEGSSEIEIEAGAGTGVTDVFTICTTSFAPPTLAVPLREQIRQDNPSMASVFTLHAHSALGTSPDRPAVRVPPNWSFSVGFLGGTYAPARAGGDLFYEARMEDGSPLPSWIRFNDQELTFDGYTRSPPVQDPETLSLVLIATDQRGYSAFRDPFDIIVASHELSATSPQAALAINVTQGEPVDFDFRAADGDNWFFDAGLLLNNGTLSADNLSSLSVDSSGVPWLSYDSDTLRLGGQAPKTASEDGLSVPLTVSAVNQSLPLNATIRILPSYFAEPVFDSMYAAPGSSFSFSLKSHLSNSPAFDGHDVNLTASMSPPTTSSFLHFDVKSLSLSGTIPHDVDNPFANVTFVAYDLITRAASHASLTLSFTVGGKNSATAASNASSGRHRMLVLALGITFGIIGGIVLIFMFLACCRRCFIVPDSAIDPYSGKGKAYIIEPDVEKNGWTERLGLGIGSRRGTQGSDTGASSNPPCSPALATFSARSTAPDSELSSVGQYRGLGIGYAPPDQSKMVKKRAFFQGIKTAVRRISGTIGSSRNRKEISKPVLVLTRDSADTLASLQRAAGTATNEFGPESSFQSVNVNVDDSERLSLGMDSSLNSSIGRTAGQSEKSIPRRRADFGPPRSPLGVHTPSTAATESRPSSKVPTKSTASTPNTKRLSKRQSTDTQRTQSSGDFEEEAIITTASRAASIRSGHSSYSYIPSVRESMARPRLVQFTSAKGVPVPVPSLSVADVKGNRDRDVKEKGLISAIAVGKRRVSHVADLVDAEDTSLTEGMRYVRAFGDANAEQSKPVASTSKRSSRSAPGKISPAITSNSSSHTPLSTQSSYVYPSPSASFDSDMNYRGSLVMSRILVRIGEAFSFKLPVNANTPPPPLPNGRSSMPPRGEFVARQLHGGKLPGYLSYGPVSSKTSSKRVEIEFWGTPDAEDAGEIMVGVYDDHGECVGKLAIEAVSRN